MMADELLAEAETWGSAPNCSARSVLVTVFGDAIAPLVDPTAGSDPAIWFGVLAELARPFGFSERLVRTSLSRLVADGWVESERVGRRSRYRLTPYGRHETAEAEERIYGPLRDGAAEQWLLVLSGPDHDASLLTHLRWRGFAEISTGVWAHPQPISLDPAEMGGMTPLTATATFHDPGRLVASGTFRSSTGLDRTELAYLEFLDHYERLVAATTATGPETGTDTWPVAAFALRIMLVHDYRRIRLAEPDLPLDVLGPDWVGRTARDLVARAYTALGPATWDHITARTGYRPGTATPRQRFAAPPHPGEVSSQTEPPLLQGAHP